VIETLAEETT